MVCTTGQKFLATEVTGSRVYLARCQAKLGIGLRNVAARLMGHGHILIVFYRVEGEWVHECKSANS